MPLSRPRVRLRPGTRVCDRGAGLVQVGLYPDQRLVLPGHDDVRRVLTLLQHGVDPERLPAGQRSVCDRLAQAGLVAPIDEPAVLARLREAARVRVDAAEPLRATVARLLAAVGLPEAARGAAETVRLIVVTGGEAQRGLVDRAMQADLPHLLVTAVAGRVRVGPCVVPGLTACLRCVDEHLTDRDPRHPLLVEQHLDPRADDVAAAADVHLALAWAVRDLVALVEGGQPSTWSATAEVRAAGTTTQRWRRHPRCGCAWGDALAG